MTTVFGENNMQRNFYSPNGRFSWDYRCLQQLLQITRGPQVIGLQIHNRERQIAYSQKCVFISTFDKELIRSSVSLCNVEMLAHEHEAELWSHIWGTCDHKMKKNESFSSAFVKNAALPAFSRTRLISL